MDNGIVFDYLKKRYGISVNTDYYTKINEWNAWWRGFVKPFHEFSENGACGVPRKRELYRMNMAKKVCEDWASLLLTEKAYITAADDKADEWLRGKDGLHGFLSGSEFMAHANRLVEKTFALGTGACILKLDGVFSSGGRLAGGEDSSLAFDFVDASHIIPISQRNGKITEAAFVSEIIEDGRDFVYIELHRLLADGYTIYNERLKLKGGELIACEDEGNIMREVRTGSKVPFFAILTPNITNNIDERCGLGASVFSDAIDCLKGVDLAFNNFCRDIKLGGKKVFLNQSLIMRDERGAVFTPDDVAQQLFVTIGDGDLSENLMITEHNPDLRTAENADAVQHQLDYLSFRCGLGTRHYLFSGVQGKAQLTATQYMGERQDMIQNVAKHRIHVESFLISAARAALWAAKNILGVNLDERCDLTVHFDDSYFIDSESERERDRIEVAAGLLRPYEYRMRWRGENEETARRNLGDAPAEDVEKVV